MYMIFASLAPIFLIIFVGFIIERIHYLPESTGDGLSYFAINICIPCLLFHIMSTTTPEQFSQGNWWLGMIGSQVGALALFFCLERYLRKKDVGPSMISSLSCVFCNAGFVGLSVIINLFPDNPKALSGAGLSVVACNVVVVIGQMVMLGRSRQKKMPDGRHINFVIPLRIRIWRFIRRFILGNSLVMATVFGLSIAFLEIPLWEPLDKACAMLGYVSPTCMLFALGFSLRKNLREAFKSHSISLGHQIWMMGWRLVGLPLVTLAALSLLDCDPVMITVSVIMMATGTAVMVASLAQVYQAVPGQASLTVAVTNILSLFSLMGAIWLLTWLELMPPMAVL